MERPFKQPDVAKSGDTLNSRDALVGPGWLCSPWEVCGRWSKETQSFLSSVAHAKARSETSLMRRRVEQAWRLRWGFLFSCTVARVVATSLVELPGARGADGDCPPSYEVERDFRHAGLSLQFCGWCRLVFVLI